MGGGGEGVAYHCSEATFSIQRIVFAFTLYIQYFSHLTRQFSGATVQIEENKKDSRMSDVVIAGTPEAVSCATFLINARLDFSIHF